MLLIFRYTQTLSGVLTCQDKFLWEGKGVFVFPEKYFERMKSESWWLFYRRKMVETYADFGKMDRTFIPILLFTLGSGNLREAVIFPPGEDPNEWLVVNSLYTTHIILELGFTVVIDVRSLLLTFFSVEFVWFLSFLFLLVIWIGSLTLLFAAVDFFNQVNLLYGTLTEFCTAENCPTMTAGCCYAIAVFYYPYIICAC